MTQALKTWSATQASKYLLCPRAWAFEYVEGHRPPASKSTELGKAVHKLLEAHLLGASLPADTDPRALPVAEAMSRCLPAAPVIAVERGHKRGRWRGFLDLEYRPAPDRIGVADHKTRRSLRKYVPTEVELANDLQATIYVYLVAGEYALPPEADVQLWWTFGQTEGAPKAKAVRSSLRVAEAERRVALLDQAVVTPGDALRAAATPANMVTPNPAACNRYGGCPHRERCHLTAEQRLLGMIQQQENNMQNVTTLWQDIAQELEGRGAGGPYVGINRPQGEAAPGQPQAQSYTPAPGQPQAQSYTQAPSQPQAQSYTQAPSQPQAPAYTSAPSQPQAPAYTQAPSQPQAPAYTSAPSQPPARSVIWSHVKRAGYWFNGVHESDAGEVVNEQGERLLAFDGADGVYGSDGNQWRKLTWAEAEACAAAWPNDPDKQTSQAQPYTPARGQVPGLILLVGCTTQGARSLAPLLREANERASAAAGVPDYRAVEYGRGPALFLAHLRGLLDERLTEGTIVEIDPRSPEGLIALVELESRASLTVRGY